MPQTARRTYRWSPQDVAWTILGEYDLGTGLERAEALEEIAQLVQRDPKGVAKALQEEVRQIYLAEGFCPSCVQPLERDVEPPRPPGTWWVAQGREYTGLPRCPECRQVFEEAKLP